VAAAATAAAATAVIRVEAKVSAEEATAAWKVVQEATAAS
jgi:hypothetical protein